MDNVTNGRPHAQRLRADLGEIRAELLETVKALTPDDLNWAPRPDQKMKSFKQILQEIGAMEKLTCHMAIHQEELDWSTVWQSLDKNDSEALLSDLTAIRTETLAYLDACTEEQLQTPIPLTSEWQGYFHAPVVEPEELMRWIVRHEYYHLGQLVIYQWQRGHNPTSDA
jgi:uncharacterized damage-inducible protein DinB